MESSQAIEKIEQRKLVNSNQGGTAVSRPT